MKPWTEEERAAFLRGQKWLSDHSSDHISDSPLTPDPGLQATEDEILGRMTSQEDEQSKCDHGVTFDEEAARAITDGWQPKNDIEFVMGNPSSSQVRKRWPRLQGVCPKGCGFSGIAYASSMHYIMGDW